MAIACDTHVHLYDNYDLVRFIESARRNLINNAKPYLKEDAVNTSLVLCLCERFDCSYFSKLPELLQDCPNIAIDNTAVNTSHGKNYLKFQTGGLLLYLISGRQIATLERLEILALAVNEQIPDGMSFKAAHAAIKNHGGISVLPWSAGKWIGKRRKIVEQIINELSPSELLIGDTSLRPRSFSEPKLMKLARRKGFHIIAGSDPLPLDGEDIMAGRYGIFSSGNFDALLSGQKDAAIALKSLLFDTPNLTTIGQRRNLLETINCLWKLRRTTTKLHMT